MLSPPEPLEADSTVEASSRIIDGSSLKRRRSRCFSFLGGSSGAGAADVGGSRRSVSSELRQLFCANSSLRGVPRIVKAESAVLRCLWLLFVLSMLGLLMFSSYKIVVNYFQADVGIQTSILSNHVSDFPAVTLCNHYPFSARAAKLWASGRVASPSQFNEALRAQARQLMTAKHFSLAGTLTRYDQVNVYYQWLNYSQTVLLGQSVREFLLHCMVTVGSHVYVGNERDCQLRFQLVSHPRYFNCYTVQPTSHSQHISAVYLILDLGSVAPDQRPSSYERAFVSDVFDQAFGLRLLLHESRLYPDIEQGGVNVEPGKMVEVSFDTVLWQEAPDCPTDKCHTADTPRIVDLKNSYAYSFEACVRQEMNALALSRCGCVISRYPRPPGVLSGSVTYCGALSLSDAARFFKHLFCLNKIDWKAERNLLEGDRCLKRCNKFYYEKELSITRWRASDFQLHWMLNQSLSWKHFKDVSNNASVRQASLRSIMSYLSWTNLSDIPRDSEHEMGKNFAYVVVRRKSFNTVRREEKLTVTFEALVSRIGGLCSLYLGLTMACFVEILEFLYLAVQYFRKRATSEQRNRRHESGR